MTTTHHPPEAAEASEAATAAGPVAPAGPGAPAASAAQEEPAASEVPAASDASEAAEEPGEAGETDTASEAGTPGEPAQAPGAPGRLGRLGRLWQRAARWPRRRVAAVAVLLVVVLASGGLLYGAAQLRDPAATGNRALTDTAATDQVTGDVSSALTRIFAYTPDDTQTTAQAARDVLAGHAATQYQSLFAQIREQVASQRLTLTTRVVRAGVVSLTGRRARLLVFLDQTAQRAGGAATSAAAQLSVTAQYSAGHWRITELTAR